MSVDHARKKVLFLKFEFNYMTKTPNYIVDGRHYTHQNNSKSVNNTFIIFSNCFSGGKSIFIEKKRIWTPYWIGTLSLGSDFCHFMPVTNDHNPNARYNCCQDISVRVPPRCPACLDKFKDKIQFKTQRALNFIHTWTDFEFGFLPQAILCVYYLAIAALPVPLKTAHCKFGEQKTRPNFDTLFKILWTKSIIVVGY